MSYYCNAKIEYIRIYIYIYKMNIKHSRNPWHHTVFPGANSSGASAAKAASAAPGAHAPWPKDAEGLMGDLKPPVPILLTQPAPYTILNIPEVDDCFPCEPSEVQGYLITFHATSHLETTHGSGSNFLCICSTMLNVCRPADRGKLALAPGESLEKRIPI